MKRAHLGIAVSACAVLLVWEYGVGPAGIPGYLLPRPSLVLEKWWQTLAVQLEHLAVTGGTTLAGLSLSLVAGLSLALLTIYVRPLKAVVLPVFAAFNGIPKLAIAPLFVTWFGLGAEPKVLLAFLMGLFPIFVSSVTGLGEIELDVLDLAKLAGGNEWRIFRKVRLPNALPYLTDALKVAFPLALAGSIVGEFIGGNHGIGYLILSGQSNLDTTLVFACLVSVTLFTTVGIALVVVVEQVFLGWRPSRRRKRES
ncbi:MAG TPA: ABC transporter permease [Vicinamibacteria bacterium]|jgi:NitT/TauT family transport system permease protein